MELEKAAPQPGELLAIRRLPDRENAEGVAYRCYRVVVDRDESAQPFADSAPAVDAPPDGDWTFAGNGEGES